MVNLKSLLLSALVFNFAAAAALNKRRGGRGRGGPGQGRPGPAKGGEGGKIDLFSPSAMLIQPDK